MLMKPPIFAGIKFLRKVLLLPSRGFLPQSYYCDDIWKSRLSHPTFKNTTARDLGVAILQAISSNRPISPLDYDTFTNKIHELDVVSTDFIENIIEKYTHTQSAVEVIDSSTHALVRAYIDFHKYDNLLNLAKRRTSTGVFLDTIAANMLADRFIDLGDWGSVIHVIWELCLQNYFYGDSISPLPVVFSLLAGVKLVQDLPPEPVPASVDESDEIQYIFVPYVRNPNYDNFFDIERLRLKLGFLWLQIGRFVDSRTRSLDNVAEIRELFHRTGPKLMTGLKLFGLSLSEQLDSLQTELSKLSSTEQLKKNLLSKYVLEKLLEVTGSAFSRDDTEPIERGRPVQPTKSQVSSAVAQIQHLIELSEPLPHDFLTECDCFSNAIASNEACLDHETLSVRQMYDRFVREREARWCARDERSRKDDILRNARQTLREIVDEEERLNYFRDLETISLKAWLAPRTIKERRWSRMKEWRRDIARHHEKQQEERESRIS